jgi:DNA polymerase/3'-5' exonuclease PolX
VEVFEKVADLLEIEGENRFKVRAYRDAAHGGWDTRAAWRRWLSRTNT